MRTNQIRWQLLITEGKSLAHLAENLSQRLSPNRSQNFSGGPEWEYDERSWFRHVLPAIGDVSGIALQNRLNHFVVEVRSFLRDKEALRETASNCPEDQRVGQLLYDPDAINRGWDFSWRSFLNDYEKIRTIFSRADLECEDSYCGKPDEISLPLLPELSPYWSMEACEETMQSKYDD